MDRSFPDYAQFPNLPLIEELYAQYLKDPEGVDLSWRRFFEGVDFAGALTKSKGLSEEPPHLRIFELVQSYRRFGHLAASFNPLEVGEKKDPPELRLDRLGFSESELDQPFATLGFCGKKEAPLREIVAALKEIYASRIGFEYMDLGHVELEKWIQERIEPVLKIEPSMEEKHLLLEYLYKSEIFETFIHTKYVGQTRFSLEGAETMIPVIAEMIDVGADLGLEEILIGMAHRGRLNVLSNILNKPLTTVFEEFEDDTTLSFAGNDDVKYHMGFTGEIKTKKGKKIPVSIAANPSHLESVDPVVLGQVRALQVKKKDAERRRIGAILIHGDASVAGQGVIYETLQLMNLPDYSTGGTIHLVVNNQIGYTTTPEEGRSTRYATDIAKAFSCPVFHVNAEDPESCLIAAKLAVEIRQKFQCDVFLDLLCYRKYGHNEGDEPSYTQPTEYKIIRSKKPIREIYYEKLTAAGFLEQKIAETLEAQYKGLLTEALESAKAKKTPEPEPRPDEKILEPFPSGVSSETLKKIADTFCHPPQPFHVHPKLKKWLEDRYNAVSGDPTKKAIDWATAECLAFGSILLDGRPVRLAGEDCKRGTFSQRHVVLIDSENGTAFCGLCKLKEGQGRFDAINSPLTEFAGMAFEYGYTWSYPEALVLWEAQYGDFNNGAQIVIDQYLASGEQKWNTPSSLTLLLPHAYEGAGPEHSSARMERFLQLSAENNIQVVNASTPAQYFHVLRRQALRKVRKPLILFTPKSLLRSPANTSPLNDLITGSFQEILDDPTQLTSCRRLIFCSGKIYYDLNAEREKRKTTDIAIVRVEQIYPLHQEKIKKLIGKYKGFTECLWVQEEPENAGAWSYIGPYLQSYLPKETLLRYEGRPSNPTTATGSHKKHKQEQQALVDRVLRVGL
ncbi:MAG: 2-oxoglutarate dehydrogenase E1 component [Verrucomicrobia bacterium]|nr:2-oxoglutarate dehydrogenase E1 component [Verrucomicrobiota bacterium]